MGKRMDVIEKIAREIFWHDFGHRRPKAAYWHSLSEEARSGYMREAELFAWVYCTVPVDWLNELKP